MDCRLPIADCRTNRRAFSLTELLIVIGLIVLMIALAVPTFNFITGNKSVEGAQNTVAAMLGRARVEAIGLQEVRGVFFFIERATGRAAMALVREVDAPETTAPNATFAVATGVDPTAPPEVWLDLVPETDFVTLPPGVMLQTVDDAMVNATGSPKTRVEDGYLGYNRRNEGNPSNNPATPASDARTLYGGVILFDGSGQLVSRRYAFKTFFVSPPGSTNRFPTRMGDLLYKPKGDPLPAMNPPHEQQIDDCVPLGHMPSAASAGLNYYPKSQIGVVLFDRERWLAGSPNVTGQSYDKELDWQFQPVPAGGGNSYANSPSTEHLEEQWIDENAVPLLVNRYNGTLVKSQ